MLSLLSKLTHLNKQFWASCQNALQLKKFHNLFKNDHCFTVYVVEKIDKVLQKIVKVGVPEDQTRIYWKKQSQDASWPSESVSVQTTICPMSILMIFLVCYSWHFLQLFISFLVLILIVDWFFFLLLFTLSRWPNQRSQRHIHSRFFNELSRF